MNIRTKIVTITLLFSIITTVVVYAIASPIILRGFLKVEDESIVRNVQRASEALQSDTASLNDKVTDWSNWDDAYTFALNKNSQYIDSNFTEVIDNPLFDAQLYFSRNGELIYGYDEESRPANLIQILDNAQLLKLGNVDPKNGETYSEKGILVSGNTLVMYAAQPILKTDGTGPAHGTIVFTKYLSKEYLQSISRITHLDVSMYATTNAHNPRDIQDYIAKNKSGTVAITKPDKNIVNGYRILADKNTGTSVVIKVSTERSIYRQGVHSARLFKIIITVINMLFIFTSLLLLELIVTRRLTRLTAEVTAIKGDSPLQHHISLKGSDELAKLAANINGMLNRIHSSTQQVSKLVTELKHEKTTIERQVTDRTAELKAQKDRFLSSINSLPHGFMLTDEHGKVLMTNPNLATVLGLQNLTPDSLKDIKSPLHSLLLEATEAARHKTTSYRDINTNDGRFLHVSTAPVLSDRGKIEGVVVLVEDITDDKIVERSKAEFFSIASHELRTPLTAIRGNTQMIREFYPEPLKDPELREMIDDIHTSSIRLIDIVNDFLDASSLEQGKIKFNMQDFAIDEVIEKVIYEMSSVASDKNIKLEAEKTLDKLPKVHGDANRIKQVIYNLVGNALKLTEQGSVTISAMLDQSNNTVKVTVTDTGPGISPEGKQLLFHKFQQTNESLYTRDTTRGTGLGLYISKLIVGYMGGDMKLEDSVPGKGSTFSFTIPIAKPKK